MLHGYGSKKPVFDAFSKYLEDDFPVVIINGLFPKFNAKKVRVDTYVHVLTCVSKNTVADKKLLKISTVCFRFRSFYRR